MWVKLLPLDFNFYQIFTGVERVGYSLLVCPRGKDHQDDQVSRHSLR
jgi:hypothetical protein